MRVTHLGHSCLFVELAEVRVLIDPGAFFTGFEDLRDLDAVVVTHQHADHLDQGRVAALLAANRQAAVYADPESAQLILRPNTDVVTTVAGQTHRVGAATLAPGGRAARRQPRRGPALHERRGRAVGRRGAEPLPPR